MHFKVCSTSGEREIIHGIRRRFCKLPLSESQVTRVKGDSRAKELPSYIKRSPATTTMPRAAVHTMIAVYYASRTDQNNDQSRRKSGNMQPATSFDCYCIKKRNESRWGEKVYCVMVCTQHTPVKISVWLDSRLRAGTSSCL